MGVVIWTRSGYIRGWCRVGVWVPVLTAGVRLDTEDCILLYRPNESFSFLYIYVHVI
jgi:hypothetical protein